MWSGHLQSLSIRRHSVHVQYVAGGQYEYAAKLTIVLCAMLSDLRSFMMLIAISIATLFTSDQPFSAEVKTY